MLVSLVSPTGIGRAVGVELLEGLGGGEDAGLVEALLDGLLEVEHRGGVGDLDLDGEGGLGAGDDGGGHGDLLGFRREILQRGHEELQLFAESCG